MLSQPQLKLPIDNEEVVQFKKSTPSGYHDRAHVKGTVTNVFKSQTGHSHFEITLLSTNTTLEVIYSMSFGGLTPIVPGLVVEACGDYITANEWNGGYKPSPDGAIIHWVHRSNNRKHDHGYLVINGELFGQK